MLKKNMCLFFFIIMFFISWKSALTQGNWELVLPPSPTSNQLVSLHFIDEITGWAVGEYGTILKTTDAGKNWRLIEINQLNYLKDVYFPTASVGYAVGQDGIIIKSIDAGESWSPQPIRFTNNLNRVRFRNENSGWIIGEKGLILHTSDGGMNWEQQTSNSREHLYGLTLVPDTTALFVVGNDSTILVTYDDGQSWQRRISVQRYTQHKYFSFKDVYFLNKSYGWIGGAGGYGGILLFTTDGGDTWKDRNIIFSEFSSLMGGSRGSLRGIQQIYFVNRRYGFCLTDNSQNIPFYTGTSGSRWDTYVHGSLEACAQSGRLVYLSGNRIINTGYRGEFRISSDKGVTWEFPNQSKRNFWDLYIANQGYILARMQVEHQIWKWARSDNYGKSWQIFTPQFYDQNGNPQREVDYYWLGNFFKNGTTSRIICDRYYEIDTCSVYESRDFGMSWHLIHTQASNLFVNPQFLTENTLIEYSLWKKEVAPDVYKSELEFQYSFDSGRTAQIEYFQDVWNMDKTTYPFIGKDYFFNGHTGFLVGSEGNIIKTTDTGRSWENIQSGVVEDLWDITFVNRQTGFVVGDFGRILKTEDGGQTWRKTDSGTQEDVYSIGFKNETEGWAGTETGLRYTTDGGETWQGVPLRYFHGPIREIEFDKDGTGYAYTHKFYPNEDKDSRPGGYILLLVLKEGGVVVENAPGNLPRQFSLSQNYPNPFNSTTHIRFSLPETEKISLKIFNIQGRLVRTLLDETRKSGEHAVVWDGTTNNGKMTASGIYIYRLTRNGEVQVRKLLLLK